MPKVETPSFVVLLRLKTSSADRRALETALDVGRMLYNACLGEALRRLDLMRESKAYRATVRLPKDSKERVPAFKILRERYEFKDSAIQSYGIKTKNACHIGHHLDAHTTQKVASRAFDAVSKYAFGKKGRPRFKGKGQFDSLEGKTNASGIRYREGWLEWRGLGIQCLIPQSDEVIAYGLSHRIKFCRLVRRKIKGKSSFYVQLVVEGLPLVKEKNRPGVETVGVDSGPSTIAYVGETKADLKQFCSELESIEKEIGLLQRKLDRQRRANNPGNYNKAGTIKKGAKRWVLSVGYKETRAELADLQHRHAEYRKSLHGKLANEIVRVGKDLHIENNSYKSFQKNFGKSVGKRAPGMFVSGLIRKAERAGGSVWDIPAYILKLSQLCICGTLKKKPLSQRLHSCECGALAQRDLFSAFLARCAEKDGDQYILDTSKARTAWLGAEPLMRQVVSRILDESANGGAFPASFGLQALRQSGSPVKPEFRSETGGRTTAKAGDVVTVSPFVEMNCESPEKVAVASGRTPRL